MNDEQLGVALKEAADRWRPPAFDAAAIAAESADRSRRARRRGIGSLAGAVVIAGAVTTAALIGPGSTTSPDARGSAGSPRTPAQVSPSRSLSYDGNAPAIPPPVRIRALRRTGERLDGEAVLVRVHAGVPATVRARLGFYRNRPAWMRNTAIVVARPGTATGAWPGGAGSYYRSSRVAISARVSVISPMHRILSVTTPADLPPGAYPVLTVVHAGRPAGQPGQHGPFEMTSKLGVIVITRRH